MTRAAGRRSLAALLAVAASALVTLSCGMVASDDPSGASPLLSLIAPAGSDATAVLVGAGDIGSCETVGPQATARLLEGIRGTVFLAGDNAYPSGSAADYRNCFDPTWGRHRSRMRPVPGNHEYETPGASAYFDYFGASAGPRGLGYYSYAVGPWLILAVNSEVPSTSGSAQYQWVSDELTRDPRPCTAVIWHRPLFSSGVNGPNPDMRDLWRLLHKLDVELVINGHEHLYERFGPQDAEGRPDPERGVRQFTVGTGGGPTTPLARGAANSQAAASVWGVVKFTLESRAYLWEFIPAEGEPFRDSGAAPCH